MQTTTTNVLDDELSSFSSLEERLRHIASRVPGPIAFATSLGMEDQAILHAIASVGMAVDVLTLDTGRHFAETLDTLDASVRRYNRAIRVLPPDARDVEELVARDGVYGFRDSVGQRRACCDVRKVRPLARGLKGTRAWMTGLRRDQSQGRAHVPFAELESVSGRIKLNPIADWTLERLQAYLTDNDVPLNALHARGFPSIGCQPCTRAVRPGEDIRAGRWWWENEDGKECGLHNRPAAVSVASNPFIDTTPIPSSARGVA